MRELRCLILSVAIGALSLTHPGSLPAQTAKPTTAADFTARMGQDGWREVTSGVLQRTREGKKTEVVAFGKPGLEWAVTEAKNRLGFFLREYRRSPSADGAKALVAQNEEVKRLERALSAAPTTKAGDLESFLNASCDFSYGATADAYPLTTSQGVGAVANAYFNNSTCSGGNNCGYIGEVYSYAYVTARIGGTTTIKFQRDPEVGVKTGASLTSSASQTQTGTNDCYSEASSSVTVATLGLFLSAYDSNSECPGNPPTISAINGLTYFYLNGYNCQSTTYTASVTGGTPGYTYKWYWNGIQVATGASYSRTFCGSNTYSYFEHTLSVTVTDSAARQDSESTWIAVEGVPTGGGCRQSTYGKYIPIDEFPIC